MLPRQPQPPPPARTPDQQAVKHLGYHALISAQIRLRADKKRALVNGDA